MKVDLTKELAAFDGTVLRNGDKSLTVCEAATIALSAPLVTGPDQPERVTGEEKGKRFALASRLHAHNAVHGGAECHLSADDVKRIMHCVELCFTGTDVFGSMMVSLDPEQMKQWGYYDGGGDAEGGKDE